MIRVYLINGCQHVVRARIHRLPAFNDIIHTQFAEDLIHSFPDRNCDKAHRFSRLFFLLLSSLLRLLSSHFLSIPDQLFLMFFPHIIDLHSGKLPVCERFLDRKSRIICVDMDLYDIIIRNAYNRIPDRLEISFEFYFIFCREFLFCHNNKFCTVSEFNICLSLLSRLDHLCSGSCLDRRIIDLFAEEGVISTPEHFKQSLSARIDYPCFLQNRQHLRSLCQHFLRMTYHFRKENFQIFCCLCKFSRLLGSPLCHSKDRTLLRFHDCFVCGSSRTVTCFRKDCSVDFIMFPDFFCKSTEKLGKDNTGISSCPPQRTRGDCLCYGHHIRFFQCLHLFCSRHDRQCHIRTRIPVRYRENVQFIDEFFFRIQICRSGKEHLLEHLRIYRFNSHANILLNLSLSHLLRRC